MNKMNKMNNVNNEMLYHEVVIVCENNIATELKNELENAKVELQEWQEWGMKKLTFPVKEHTEGYFIYFQLIGNNDLDKVDKVLQPNELILKYRIITSKIPFELR